MASRREFIKLSALASGMLLVPNFLHGMDKQGMPLLSDSNGRRLVVIQLNGGNDGLNTVVPYQNDIYYKSRPALAITPDQVLRLSDELGFHPSMEKMRALYEQGHLSILNNVGYPNPDRSHFRSRDIWHTASASDEYLDTGWLGRYLDACCSGPSAPYTAIEVDDSLSLALKGEQYKGLAVQDVNRFYQATQHAFLNKVAKAHHHEHTHTHVDYLYKTLIETQQSAAYLHDKIKVYRSTETYPNGEFARNLKTIAELISSGVEARVFYASLSGFDTHVRQAEQQARLLRELSEGLYSFVQDLQQNDAFNNTIIMVFSEFGRRVHQNASNGTDHGTANNVYLIGSNLHKPGFYNSGSDLLNLDQGDLKYTIDFRSIYATILQQWLQTDSSKILSSAIPPLADLL